MKISIPKSLKDNSVLINTVDIVFYNDTNTRAVSLDLGHLTMCKAHNMNAVDVSDGLFNAFPSLRYEVLFKNGIKQTFDFPIKDDAIYSPTAKVVNSIIPYTKINTKSSYKDTDSDKAIISAELISRIEEINTSLDTTTGSKNLIYYAVFGTGYADLLETSLKTIHSNSSKNFDILIITDLETQTYISSKDIIKEFVGNYLVVDTPEDGIAASMCKSRVFEYEFIDEYNKILFLDADIICVKDISTIFDNITSPDKLYTVYNPTVNTGSFLTLYHGLKYRSQEIKDKADLKGYRPFNAGQFGFMNSSHIKAHFVNMNWGMSVWPGAYFFEQSFMNVYCVIADIIDQSLNDFFIIGNATVSKPVKIHNDESILIHFTAPALDSATKTTFIDRYLLEFV